MSSKPDPVSAAPAQESADVGAAPAEASVARLSAAQQDALHKALEDLAELDEYAEEVDFPPPAPTAKEAARVFLQAAVRETPRHYAVSPWDKGTVVVHSQSAKGFRVDIFFDANGSASCYVNRPESKGDEEHHYAQARRVANPLTFAALRELEE